MCMDRKKHEEGANFRQVTFANLLKNKMGLKIVSEERYNLEKTTT